MKRYWIAAGTLLLSTSALAVAADTKDMAAGAGDAEVTTESKAFESEWDKALLAGKTGVEKDGDVKLQTASLDEPVGDKLAAADTGSKFQTASADSFDKPVAADGSAKFQTASADSFAKPMAADTSAKLQTASMETLAKPQAEHSGMGGPLVEADAGATALNLTPQPAAQSYPACSPGPGDDRCIQLYEPGVRDQLASWNRPTGGLLDGNNATAMGGPYEPAADAAGKPAQPDLASVYKPEGDTAMGGPYEPVDESEAKPAETQLASVYKADSGTAMGGPLEPAESELAMNGDGSIDATLGETADPAADTQLAQHDAFTGVGGPVEAQSGYPPCSPGPSADRCIQLYEAGVTGAGN